MIYAHLPDKPETKIMIFLLPTAPPPHILGVSVTLLGIPQTFLKDAALLTATDEGTDLSSQVFILSRDQQP